MSPNALRQMVACGFIEEVIISSFPDYFTISFLSTSGVANQHPLYLTYDDNKGHTKHFHSAKSLYAKINEILSWPVNPETFHTLDTTSIHINFICSPSLERSSITTTDNQLPLPI